jgi:acetyltransferase-like isoleucine patch superfamily enzyme
VADTTIGRYCTFASRISVGAFSHPTDWLSIHEFQYRDIGTIYGETIIGGGRNLLQTGAKATHIGSDVWIGDNAAIGRGVTIGDGAIVGLGAVVVQDVEPFAIVVGNPARVVRKRFPDAVVDDLMRLQWWTLGMAELAGVDFRDVRGAIDDIKRRVDRRREAKPS